MAYEFYLGLDLTEERAVLSLVEKAEAEQEDAAPTFHVRRLETRNEAPADVAAHVQNLLIDAPYAGRTIVVVNKTQAPGQEALDGLVERGLTPIGVTLSGGDAATQTSAGLARTSGGDVEEDVSGFVVSEHVLVETADRLYHDGRLKMPENDEAGTKLAQGLQSYHARAAEAGDALNAIGAEPRRAADHSAPVLATAVACWLGTQRSFDPTEHLAGDPPPVGAAKRT